MKCLDGLSTAKQRIHGPHFYGEITLDDVVVEVKVEKCQNIEYSSCPILNWKRAMKADGCPTTRMLDVKH